LIIGEVDRRRHAIHRRRKSWENPDIRPSEVLAAQRQRVLAIAAAGGARNVRVFGSVLTGRDRPDSDLDLLVELAPGTSLLRIVGLQLAIEDALGIKVDLCTERELHPALKERILAEASPL
jgi:predicted nucleotidyltransferase